MGGININNLHEKSALVRLWLCIFGLRIRRECLGTKNHRIPCRLDDFHIIRHLNDPFVEMHGIILLHVINNEEIGMLAANEGCRAEGFLHGIPDGSKQEWRPVVEDACGLAILLTFIEGHHFGISLLFPFFIIMGGVVIRGITGVRPVVVIGTLGITDTDGHFRLVNQIDPTTLRAGQGLSARPSIMTSLC